MDLRSKIDAGNYNGIVTFSDIHSHAKKLKKGIRYAIKNNLFIVLLGDLVDGHNKPLEVVLTVKELLNQNRACLVIGNHDDKFYRYAIGNKVLFKSANEKTLADVKEKARPLFLQTIIDLVEHPNSAYMHRLGKWRFIHGAAHADVWVDPTSDELTKKAKHRALYGEVTGERDEDDFPVREYNWIDEIPPEHGVVVGHDRNPLGKGKLTKTGPLTHQGAQGGRAVFTDMGAGKCPKGKLCLLPFYFDGDGDDLIPGEYIAI